MRKTNGGRGRKKGNYDDRSRMYGRKDFPKENDHQFEKRKKVILDFMKDDLYVPMKIKGNCRGSSDPGEQRQQLRDILDALVEEGKITISKRGKYTCGHAEHLEGTFQANARGFGFVTPKDGGDDIFIPEECLGNAFQGDVVEYIVTSAPTGKRKEGKIVNILSHGVTHIVGLYEKCKSFGFVRPDNKRYVNDIYIPAGREMGAVTGNKVVVEMTSYGGEHMKPEGRVSEIIGHVNDPGTDILSIVMDLGIKTEFPERVLNQAVRVGKPVSEADRAGRKDLTDVRMVTIDSEDAKDLDDAVSVERDGENYVLGVHIADVTNYVQERSALDREALERGTSVYLADRVIPMLPHVLSNGICSLNAGEDRLALSCIMTISPDGEMISHEIAESVICVDKRMSYNGVSAVLAQEEEALREQEEFVPMILLMKELSEVIREKRGNGGLLILIFQRRRFSWMKVENRLRSNRTIAIRRQRLSKILCSWQMRRWRKSSFGVRSRSFTGRTSHRMRIGSDSFLLLLIISATISM